jgi:hypothetical protein
MPALEAPTPIPTATATVRQHGQDPRTTTTHTMTATRHLLPLPPRVQDDQLDRVDTAGSTMMAMAPLLLCSPRPEVHSAQ